MGNQSESIAKEQKMIIPEDLGVVQLDLTKRNDLTSRDLINKDHSHTFIQSSRYDYKSPDEYRRPLDVEPEIDAYEEIAIGKSKEE